MFGNTYVDLSKFDMAETQTHDHEVPAAFHAVDPRPQHFISNASLDMNPSQVSYRKATESTTSISELSDPDDKYPIADQQLLGSPQPILISHQQLSQSSTSSIDISNNKRPANLNSKQYHRILKRRAARQRLKELLNSRPKPKLTLYAFPSGVSCVLPRRPQDPDGRFMSAEEVVERNETEAPKGVSKNINESKPPAQLSSSLGAKL